MADSLELSVTLKCTSEKTCLNKKLVCSPYPTRVADIKEHIQKTFSIPKCMQKLEVNGHSLNADSQLVSETYMRSGDSLSVTFLAEADVAVITELAAILKSLSAKLTALAPALFSDVEFRPNSVHQDIYVSLGQFVYSAQTVTQEFLIPWEVPKCEANRQLMIHEGVLDMVLELYALLLQSPFETRAESLQQAEMSFLLLMWNFMETAYARQMIARKGGFQMMLHSLMHFPGDSFLANYTINDIFECSLGCVSK